MVRTKKRIGLCLTLLVLNLALIWGNSLVSGEASGEMSGSVMEFALKLLQLPESAAERLHHLIRKAAHFTEFALLTMELTWLCGMLEEKWLYRMVLPVAGGMLAALVDESLQMLTPGRGPSLVDVWIDTSGAVAGMMILLTGYHLLKRMKKHSKILEETIL